MNNAAQKLIFPSKSPWNMSTVKLVKWVHFSNIKKYLMFYSRWLRLLAQCQTRRRYLQNIYIYQYTSPCYEGMCFTFQVLQGMTFHMPLVQKFPVSILATFKTLFHMWQQRWRNMLQISSAAKNDLSFGTYTKGPSQH